ncbi:MAG TPA: VOC family protein [Candidatus Binataceae bacterium]|nr:VOC family protein [Candidatus Binataceae bacterium]
MAEPSIARLGHVGLHVRDLEKAKSFYRDILGLTVTDEDPELGMVFMSARPEEEHHEFLLCRGRNVGGEARVLQQVSFRCNSLDDVIGFYRRLKQRGIKFDMVVSHGNAVGVYFYDPEGNRIETYWSTGLKAKQPYAEPIDLEQPADELRRHIQQHVAEHGATGFVDRAAMRRQDIQGQSGGTSRLLKT